MTKSYNFKKGKRGAIVSLPPGKTRITIRLDNEVVEWFRSRVEARGGGNYQTMINAALKEHIQRGGEALEGYLRRIIREELRNGAPDPDSQSPH
jgi:hypothetical protein